jgi:ARG/rhodanese/phosphatase superfamily protein
MSATRRRFLGLAVLGGLTLATARTAGAQPIRILRGDGPAGPPDRMGPSRELGEFLADVAAGDVAHAGPITVAWLCATPRRSTLGIETLDEARAAGELTMTEQDRATVSDVVVANAGKSAVLMLAGEILLGGKQDRLVKEDVLLPPLSGPRHVGVYCVEQGRWAGKANEFSAGTALAAPSLRSRLVERTDQQQVWAEVDRSARAFAASSPTGAYARVHESPEVKARMESAERAPELRPVARAVGAAVSVGSRLAGLDAFAEPSLFAREWPKLLRAYAVEAERSPGDAPADAALRRRVTDTLRRAANADGATSRNAGAGVIFTFRVAEMSGSALIAEQRVIHVALV